MSAQAKHNEIGDFFGVIIFLIIAAILYGICNTINKMSAQNTFSIPTAAEVAREVVAQLAEKGMVVPGASLDINQAAKYLQCGPKHLRRLVELRKIKARDISAGTGEKETLRFSVVALAEYLRGE